MRRETPGDAGVAAEDLGLDLVDVGGQARDHRRVPVDDGVEDRVQHRLAALLQQRRLALQPPAHPREVRGLAVPHGDGEVPAEEQVQLAELHLLGRVEVARGLEDDEQRAAVALELRPLVGLDRVLDRQLGQVVLLGQLPELGRLGPVETQPHQALGVLDQPVVALGHAVRRRHPPARGVDGVVDDDRRPRRRLRRQDRRRGEGQLGPRPAGQGGQGGEGRTTAVDHGGLPGDAGAGGLLGVRAPRERVRRCRPRCRYWAVHWARAQHLPSSVGRPRREGRRPS